MMKRVRDDSDSEDSGGMNPGVNVGDHMVDGGGVDGVHLTFTSTTSRNPVWSGFMWSLERDKHGRRTARCKFCNSIFSGRPMRLKRHFLVSTERCKAAPEEFVESYVNVVNNAMLGRSLDNDDDDNHVGVFDGLSSPTIPDSVMKAPPVMKGRDSLGVGNTKLNMIPSTSHNPIWSGFFWSIEKDKHGRRTAQCKFCNLILGGRPMRLKRHFLVQSERCPAASEEFIEYYKNLVKMYEKDRGIEETESIDSDVETPNKQKTNNNPNKRMKTNEAGGGGVVVVGSEQAMRPQDAQNKYGPISGVPSNRASTGVLADVSPARVLNLNLLKSLIYSNLPGDLIQVNPYFQQYLGFSAPNQISPPEYQKFIAENVPLLFHECESIKKRWIEEHGAITLSIVKLRNLQDLYAYAVFGTSSVDSCFLGISEFINVGNSNTTNYLSEWFLNTFLPKYFYKGDDLNSLQGGGGNHQNSIYKVIALVSEMSGDFHQLHTDIIKFHPHIHHIPSVLDSLRAVLQEIAKIPAIQNVIKRNLAVIHSLITSPDWEVILHDYHLPKDRNFYTMFMTHSYGSIYYLCQAIQVLEPAIKDIYNMINMKMNKYQVSIHPNEVKALLHYENYFSMNSEILILLHPIVEIIQQLQRTSTPLTAAAKKAAVTGQMGSDGVYSQPPPPQYTIGHIYQFFLQINYHMENIDATTAANANNAFHLKHCMEAIKAIVFKRLLVYSSPIFAIGFYLIPKYRQILIKHKYSNLPALFQQIHELNNLWNHWKNNYINGTITTQELEHYHNNTSNLFTLTHEEQYLHPIVFWNHVDTKRHLTESMSAAGPTGMSSSALIQFAKQLFSIPVSTYAQELVLQQSNLANAGFLTPLSTSFTTLNAQEYDKLHQWMTIKYTLHVNYPIDGTKPFDSSYNLSMRDYELLLLLLKNRYVEDLENQLLLENTSFVIQNKISKDIKHYVKGFIHFFNTELYKTIYEAEVVSGTAGNNSSSMIPSLSSSLPHWTIQDLFFSN